ncbi:uncharacterized protein LOC112601899 [Melanaphis sacchari]|uniref:uncharacterized protein LOC112601899 n=1 Tax=Melanaphis sacchari TaxID=742174 RepID=UPI000DC1582C|nr:uncharacterized protein LOC112601899 [Melanaphis sacchari]
MFKYTVVIAAVVVVSASLANSVPANSSPTSANLFDPMIGAATAAHKNKHVKPDHHQPMFAPEPYNGQRNNRGGGGGSSVLESGLSALLEAISIPKKIIGSVIGSVVDLLKSVDLKKLIKIALIGGAVIVLGAVAAAGVAGVAAVVAAVSAAIPYIRFFFGGHKGEASDSEMDLISDFVLSAFNKYDSLHKAE